MYEILNIKYKNIMINFDINNESENESFSNRENWNQLWFCLLKWTNTTTTHHDVKQVYINNKYRLGRRNLACVHADVTCMHHRNCIAVYQPKYTLVILYHSIYIYIYIYIIYHTISLVYVSHSPPSILRCAMYAISYIRLSPLHWIIPSILL